MIRIIAAAVIFAAAEISGLGWLAIIAYAIAGYDVLWKAIRNILKGKIFDENFLMAVATIGALFIRAFDEAAGVMIFYQVGEYFQDKAVRASRSSIKDLMDIAGDTAEMETGDGFIRVPSEDVPEGSRIRIVAGAKVPIDGVVEEGETHLDTKALTGEALPVWAGKGSKVLSGSINSDGTIIVRTTSSFSDSTASKILRLTQESEGKKAKTERFISRFSRVYTPFVCISALLVAIIPPVFGLADFRSSLYRACMLLVISCPCALVLSIPLTYFSAMGSMAKNGILVKGAEAIQNIARISTIAMDKTGTLTEGSFSVAGSETYPGWSKDELLYYAATLESYSNHPIAEAIRKSHKGGIASDVREIPGIGLEGNIGGKLIKAGNRKILSSEIEAKPIGTPVFITADGEPVGCIYVEDRVKANAESSILEMKALGVGKTVMLSGDKKERAESTAAALSMDMAMGELLPADKLKAFESLMEDGRITAYAGDGINDAPTLARADVAIAMGGVGSDAAIEAADCVIMNDDISRIPAAIRIAKKAEAIVRENIWLSLGVKAAVFVLALFGMTNMWAAVFADTGVLLIAVLNSMRAMKAPAR